MDDDRDVRRLESEEIAADRLTHAYAVTVHRSRGSTVQRAHALEDGGGRELAYVKMRRAKDRSAVYVIDDAEQAAEDLVRSGRPSAGRRGSSTPAPHPTDPAAVEASLRVAKPTQDALRRGRLAAERAAIAAVTVRLFDEAQKAQIWDSYEGKYGICRLPLTRGSEEYDHITPWIRGGPTSVENGRPVHAGCHQRGRNVGATPVSSRVDGR